MVTYDPTTNILKLQALRHDSEIEFNPLKDIKESYGKYLNTTLKEDLDYFFDAVRDGLGITGGASKNAFTIRLNDERRDEGEFYHGREHYIDVWLKYRDTPERRIFRLPFQDSRGVFNVDGKLKVLMNYLSASEDISFAPDHSDKRYGTINVQLGNRNIAFKIGQTSVKVKCGNQNKVTLDKLAMAALYYEHYSEEYAHNLIESITSFSIRKRIRVQRYTCLATCAIEANPLNFLWTNKDFRMSDETRRSLNYALSLDRAAGEVLYSDVYSPITKELLLKAGTTLNQENLYLLKSNLVTTIYIKHMPNILGYKLAEDIWVNNFPKGFVVPEGLCSRFNLVAGENVLPEAIVNGGIASNQMDNDDAWKSSICVSFKRGTIINETILEFLTNYGIKNLPYGRILVGSVNNPAKVTDCIEVMTNHTHLGADIGMADKNAWFVMHNDKLVAQSSIEDPVGQCPEITNIPDSNRYYQLNGSYLNGHDLMALLSLAGWYIDFAESGVLKNKDTSLLKKLQLADKAFSSSFRATVDSWVRNKKFIDLRTTLTNKGQRGLPDNVPDTTYWQFQKDWFKDMNDKKLFVPVEQINPVAVLAHVTNVSTFVKSKDTVSDDQRLLALPFYGRICPYETPSSAKIGLTNHKALGCYVNDGVMRTPYYPVTNGHVNCKKMIYMSAKEANKYIVTFPDIANITNETEDGYDLTGVMMAICPTKNSIDEVTTREVYANDVEYVFVSSIQQISATAALVPFLSSDDPARISFSLSMEKQAIFCQDNQKPRVLTGMYKNLLKLMPYYTVVAEYDGKVERIDRNGITVTYDKGVKAAIENPRTDKFMIPIEEINDRKLYAVNEEGKDKGFYRFKKGHEIAFKDYNGKAVVAPYDCEIIEVNADEDETYVVIQECNLDSPTERSTIYWSDISVSGPAVNFSDYLVKAGDTFKKGDTLARASVFRDGIYSPARNALVAYIPTSYNYEDAVEMSVDCAKAYTSISVREENFSIKSNLKRAYIHLNNGYAAPGNIIGEVVGLNKNTEKSYSDKIASRNGHGYPYDYRQKNSKNDDRSYTIRLLDFSIESEGDKMAGRHGNKGVSAHICPNSEMPMLANGKTIDIALNPCGVPSRMNLGQNLEAHLGFVAELLDIYIETDAFNGSTLSNIRLLMELVWELANNDVPMWEQIFNKPAYSFLGDTRRELFKHVTQDEEHINRILEWRGAFNKNGTARIYDPKSQRWFENPIAFGYSYFLKLEQEVSEKINSRSGMTDNSYVLCSQQPTQGRSNIGGQASGEMELITMAAYGATEFVHEIMNSKSDNVGLRYANTLKALDLLPDCDASSDYIGETNNPYAERFTMDEIANLDISPSDCTSRANDLVRYLLESLGVYTVVEEDKNHEIADISHSKSLYRKDYNMNDILRVATKLTPSKNATSMSDFAEGLDDDDEEDS